MWMKSAPSGWTCESFTSSTVQLNCKLKLNDQLGIQVNKQTNKILSLKNCFDEIAENIEVKKCWINVPTPPVLVKDQMMNTSIWFRWTPGNLIYSERISAANIFKQTSSFSVRQFRLFLGQLALVEGLWPFSSSDKMNEVAFSRMIGWNVFLFLNWLKILIFPSSTRFRSTRNGQIII